MNTNALVTELLNRDSATFRLTLSPMKRLLKALGNPEQAQNYVHVAGTNGKGSTSFYLYSLLRSSGYRVGLYTSPHLKRVNERIRVGGALISNTDLARQYIKVKKALKKDSLSASFFEILTAIAFLHFKRQKCDISIIETGLGGRLDATNTITPLMSVITSVSKEHTAYLGNTLSQIATEKAGIVKPKVPVITSASGISKTTIQKIAAKRKSYFVHASKKIVSITPTYQQLNASLALQAAILLEEKYGYKIPRKPIAVLKKTRWPGRFQWLDKNTLVDAAHNPGAIKKLCEELKSNPKKKVMVVSILDDKNAQAMMELLDTVTTTYVITKAKTNRAINPVDLANLTNKECVLIENPKQALSYAQKNSKGKVVVVTGSAYLVGNVL